MEKIEMDRVILIKYGELTTKKDNRNLFISKIYEQMKELLADYDVKIEKNRSELVRVGSGFYYFFLFSKILRTSPIMLIKQLMTATIAVINLI